MSVKPEKIRSFDGHMLAVHQLGIEHQRKLLLIHGLFSNANVNWIQYGHAELLAKAGFHVIMPDLRGHGDSDAPREQSGWPADVLVQDMHVLIDHFSLDDFDLGGFSLGARITGKLLVQGIRPNRAIMAGMGWQGLAGWGERRAHFLKVIKERDTVKRGQPHYFAAQFFKTTGMDPIASAHLLHSLGDVDREALAQIELPIKVICGDEDRDNGHGSELADRLADAQFEEITGNHMSSVTKRALGEAMVAFLSS